MPGTRGSTPSAPALGRGVSAGELTAALHQHADAVHDLLRRLGCRPAAAPGVVEAAALDVVARAADSADGLDALVGDWFAAARGRTDGATDPGPLLGGLQASGPLAGSAEQALLTAGLAARPPAGRTALLLADAYDLPPGAVAAGLERESDDALELLGRARLELLPDVYDSAAPEPAGHVASAALARLASGWARRADAGVARHVRGCPSCAAVVQAQADVRRLLGGLSLIALPDEGREASLERVAVRARSVLPAAPAATAAPRQRVLAPAPVALSVLLAVLLGVGLGAVLGRPRTVAEAQARPLPPVTAPSVTPLPGDVPRTPDPAPSTLVFTYPPTATTSAPRTGPPPVAPTAPPPTSPATPGGTLVLSPATGAAGSSIRVNGAGWVAGGTVRIVLVDPKGKLTEITAVATVGPAGRFQAGLAAGRADSPPGSYAVSATEGTYTARATYVVR